MVTADIDQTSTTQEKVDYNPDGQVVRSTSTNEGTESSTSPDASGATTASANIPGTQQAPNISTSGNNSKQTSEVTNYEISTTKTTTVTGPGEIKKLSIAVVVDGVETPSKDGKAPPTYAPRSAEDMKKIEDLVTAGVGIDAARQDQIKVTNIRFNRPDIDTSGMKAKSSMFDFDKNDIMRAAEVGVLFIVALLTIFLVARPLLKFINGGPTTYLSAANGGALAGPEGQMAMAGGGQMALAGSEGGGQMALAGGQGDAGDQRIDIARIEGQVKASSVKKVSEFVDRHPDESVAILRSWLHDG
jgi:flagellar M-ring protein FliF